MDKAKIFLEDGVEKLVNCIFYLYNSKYYFLYTENEVDENGYVRLYLVKVGKETTNTQNGIAETGNMVGIEVPTDDEWKEVQGSISKIVNSKKTKVEDKDIQYLPIDMLVKLKVVGKKTFRLLSNIIENDFGVKLNGEVNESIPEVKENVVGNSESEETVLAEQNLETKVEPNSSGPIVENTDVGNVTEAQPEIVEETVETPKEEEQTEEDFYNSDIIIDYRTKFFEEQEKNKHLNEELDKLKKKLENIVEIIKED